MPVIDDGFRTWCDALERRHLASLTFPEVRRGLQALSSLYVERRARLDRVGALDGAGKRAAFALFFGPLHYLMVRTVVRGLGSGARPPRSIMDLGCGTGASGAAWAGEVRRDCAVTGIDRKGWAVEEARWNYRALGIRGRAVRGDLMKTPLPAGNKGILLAYTANELEEAARDDLLERLIGAARSGARVLVVEPLARSAAPWWSGWADAFKSDGGRVDRWRVAVNLPERLRLLDRAAGLDHRELTGRSLALGRWGEGRRSRDME